MTSNQGTISVPSTSDGTSNAQGTTYEARMCIFLFVRAYIRNLKSFTLQYQVKEANKFDDIVFSDGNGKNQIIQLKHKESDKQLKIRHSQLFNEKLNTDFNLIKYVQAVIKANSTPQFNDKIESAAVLTNIDFELINNDELNLMTNQTANAKIWYDGLKSIKLTLIPTNPSAIFDMSSVWSNAKYYKFTDDPNIIQILKRQVETLANEKDTKKMNQGLFNRILSNIKNWVFGAPKVSTPPNKVLTEGEIREALEKIIYAVYQPNVQQLEELIKQEIKSHFKLHDADAIYEKLDNRLRNWCDTKNPIEQPSTSTQSNTTQQHVLTYNDVDTFFQKYVKVVSFGVTAPTDAFIGRTEELNKIKEKLNEHSSFIVSQSVAIRGLGGIGKTQLAKQFIKEFGQSEFYGRVIWIEAENDVTVKDSFEQLGQMLDIRDAYNKTTKALIHEVFHYFEGFKVLFVFDNFDKSPGQLVTHCLKTASDSTKKFRPFFLFTSRNRNCLPKIQSLDLDVLSPEEAIQLIINELPDETITKVDAEKLAETLRYFPLALRQAIAYIIEQQQKKQKVGKKYDIQDYFEKFEKETQALLSFIFPDDFGEYEKTTYITWNVTLEMIELDTDHGNDAIQALQIFAYLYADKIDSKMFLPMFNNDEDKLDKVFLLLEKYSMITKIDKQTSFYQIHRLVQTVVQLKFKTQDEYKFLEKTFQLIYPELYERCTNYAADFNYDYRELFKLNFIPQLSIDQILHFKVLSVHMLKYKNLEMKYKNFFDSVSDIAVFGALYTVDVDKIKALKVPTEDLRRIIRENIDHIIDFDCNNIMKYFIENDVIGVNEKIKGQSLISLSQDHENFDVFKYLIEKGADFGEVLECDSLDLILKIKTGEIDSLKNELETNPGILNECLFFAILFDQESIARDLLDNIVEILNYQIVLVTAYFRYKDLLLIMIQKCSKENLYYCLTSLLFLRYFIDQDMFEIILNNYLEKGGDVNEQDSIGDSFLNSATDSLAFNFAKKEIVHFLLDKGADPYLSNNDGHSALDTLLYAHENDWFASDDKPRIHELLEQKIFNNLTREKFVNFVAKSLFMINNWSTNEYYRNMFNRLVKKIGGTREINENGETLLMIYLQNERPTLQNVKFLVKCGVDVAAKDNNGKCALEYSENLGEKDIFQYLLDRYK